MIAVDRVKHLELIQAVVSRMANNSFLLKGWTVTLAGALLTLAAKETEAKFALIALLPALAFWGLDAFYLRHERLFRRLYEFVRRTPDEELAADPYTFSTERFAKDCPTWLQTLFTGAVVGLHGVVIVAIAVTTVVVALIKRGVIIITV